MDLQRNPDVHMKFIRFAKELILCQRKTLYYPEFNEYLSVPKQVLSVKQQHALDFLESLTLRHDQHSYHYHGALNFIDCDISAR